MSIRTLIAKMGLVATLVAASAGAYAQDIKVALGTDGFVHMPLFVAVDGGYFKKQGINVELIKFKGGGAATSGLA
ncbi:ABC transporter substrate-binding protein, partial [Pseudomonas syringae]